MLQPRREGDAKRPRIWAYTFYRRFFSAENNRCWQVRPGDTIHATKGDAGGGDEKGSPRVLGQGNPETGPFYMKSSGRRGTRLRGAHHEA